MNIFLFIVFLLEIVLRLYKLVELFNNLSTLIYTTNDLLAHHL